MKLAKWITACVMLMSLMPLSAHAQEAYSVTENEDGTVSVTWTDHSAVHVEIPETVGGKTVTALGENCFDGCSALEDVVIPETVTDIGSFAFQGCMMLETVNIPASVTFIDDFAFEGCLMLSSISVEEGNPEYCSEDGVLYSRNKTLLLRYPAAKKDAEYTVSTDCRTIAPWGFTDCQHLETVKMDLVDSIGADCFMGCRKLRDARLSDSIKELIGASFARCSNLETIHIPMHLESIGDRCFFGCDRLGSVTLPETLERIGDSAFFGCNSLNRVYVPGNVKSIGEHGIGFTVSSDGGNVVQEGFLLECPVGSYAVRYAKENKIPYQGKIARSTMIFVLVVLVLAGMLVFGIVYSIRRSQLQKRQEAERIAQEEKEKMLAERRAARKKQKEQK